MTVSTPYRQSLWSTQDIADTMRRQMSEYQQAVGKRLLALRKSRNMSQEDAMRIAGVSLKTWRNWERGLRAPYERNWQKVQEGFELTDDELAEIRGIPPAPLALGPDEGTEDGQLDRIEAKLDQVISLLAQYGLEQELAAGLPLEPGARREPGSAAA